MKIVLLAALFAASGVSIGAGERIAMKASPEISMAPAHLLVRTTIEADDANRGVEIVLDSQDYYRSSIIELDGARAPRTSIIEFRGVPGGVYEISATLLGADGQPLAYSKRLVNVISTGR